jgi:hypothetical protein
MQYAGNNSLPLFPSTPEGDCRKEHLPTVEACILYWEAMRVNAIRMRESARELTAMALRSSYEQARQELLGEASSREPAAESRYRDRPRSLKSQRRDAANEP